MLSLKHTWTLMCLLTLLGCSTAKSPSTQIEYKAVLIQPSKELLQDPADPEVKPIVVTRDITDNSDMFRKAFEQAKSQIRKIREEVEGQILLYGK